MTDTDREVRERFAANIERLRHSRKLSVDELAERSLTDERELRAILLGDKEASYATIAMLAGALGAEAGELLQGIEWIPGDGGGGEFKIEDRDGD